MENENKSKISEYRNWLIVAIVLVALTIIFGTISWISSFKDAVENDKKRVEGIKEVYITPGDSCKKINNNNKKKDNNYEYTFYITKEGDSTFLSNEDSKDKIATIKTKTDNPVISYIDKDNYNYIIKDGDNYLIYNDRIYELSDLELEGYERKNVVQSGGTILGFEVSETYSSKKSFYSIDTCSVLYKGYDKIDGLEKNHSLETVNKKDNVVVLSDTDNKKIFLASIKKEDILYEKQLEIEGEHSYYYTNVYRANDYFIAIIVEDELMAPGELPPGEINRIRYAYYINNDYKDVMSHRDIDNLNVSTYKDKIYIFGDSYYYIDQNGKESDKVKADKFCASEDEYAVLIKDSDFLILKEAMVVAKIENEASEYDSTAKYEYGLNKFPDSLDFRIDRYNDETKRFDNVALYIINPDDYKVERER